MLWCQSTEQTKNEIKYMDFINAGNPFSASNGFEDAAKKTTYQGKLQGFKGEQEIDGLLHKLKSQIKKDRIRLLEFFQDHDVLRKGIIGSQKFRGVLYS